MATISQVNLDLLIMSLLVMPKVDFFLIALIFFSSPSFYAISWNNFSLNNASKFETLSEILCKSRIFSILESY